MLQTRTCACARRALHEPPDRTSVRAARIHPSPALATAGLAVGAVRLAAAVTLATRAHLASVCSILHNGPPARTRVRPSLLDLCHGTGRSSHAAAPAIVLGAYLSTHRARRVACHKPVNSSLRCCDSMLRTRTCACARRALHEPPGHTSVRAARIHPSPALPTVGWAAGAVRLAAAATLATRAHLASVCSILHNGPHARTRVRPPLLDLCHGAGRSSHAAAPAIVLGAYLSTHRARRVACHTDQ